MIERLKVNGYLSLVDAEIRFTPLTLLLGRNGAGKSALLDSLERLGSYARGGVDRAFGPPPYSLGFLRSRGHGDLPATSFEVDLRVDGELFRYKLSLDEVQGQAKVREERVLKVSSGMVIAAWSRRSPPTSGTVLRPDAPNPILDQIASRLKNVHVFDLNPREIERPSDERQPALNRDGFGVGSFLAHLQEHEPKRFEELDQRLREMRPGTTALRVWGGAAGQLFWGIEEPQSRDWRYPAPLLSWGDRVLVGILCILFAADPGNVVGLEEVDRGFHPSRYDAVVDLLSEASGQGVGGRGPVQIIATSHSPALVSRFQHRLGELRLVSRTAGGTTTIVTMADAVKEKLGTEETSAPLGEAWAMGLLD
ncbi:MAG TPA: AAA family ATPase [Candidatus Nanopelagicales bacterium]|nr:AAA family ATPase [Candidatus Nanopelagicales bacterium]